MCHISHIELLWGDYATHFYTAYLVSKFISNINNITAHYM